MAKDDRGKIRFLMVELEGTSETLLEGIRAVAGAIARPTVVQRSIAPAVTTLSGNGSHAGDNGQTVIELSLDDVETPTEAPGVAATKKTNKQRSYKTPNILDVDLAAGTMSFRDFWTQKAPTEHSKRYLVIAGWFKEYGNVSAITADHVYTCYRYMNLNVPEDVGQAFRKMKSQGWFKSGQTRGSFEINHVGLNVLNDMGKAA